MAAPKYRTVSPGLWEDAKFKSLSKDSQWLWLFLLTGPITTNLPGIMPVGRGALSDRLKYSADQIDACMAELDESNMARHDFDAPMIWLPNAIKYLNISYKNVIGWGNSWREIPDCELKAAAWLWLESWVKAHDKRLNKSAIKQKRQRVITCHNAFQEHLERPSMAAGDLENYLIKAVGLNANKGHGMTYHMPHAMKGTGTGTGTGTGIQALPVNASANNVASIEDAKSGEVS